MFLNSQLQTDRLMLPQMQDDDKERTIKADKKQQERRQIKPRPPAVEGRPHISCDTLSVGLWIILFTESVQWLLRATLSKDEQECVKKISSSPA